jgi:ATP-binding cassette, subfamily B, bacterial MsbA
MTPNQLLLKYAFRHPIWIVITIVLGFSGALFNGVSTALIIPVLLSFLGQEMNLQGLPPIIKAPLTALQMSGGNQGAIVLLGSIVLAIVLKNLASYTAVLASSHLSRILTNEIRREGLQLLLNVDLDFYVKTKVGDLTNRLGAEVSRTANAIKTGTQILTTVITILVFVGLLLSISWKLTVMATTLLMLMALANQFYVLRAKQYGQVLADNSRAYSVGLLEILTGIRQVKATGNEAQEYNRLEKLIQEREYAEFQSQANFAVINPINEVAGILTVLTIVLLGRNLLSESAETLATVLLTYLLVLFRLLPFVGQLNSYRSTFANAAPSVAVVTEFLRRDDKPLMVSGTKPFTKLKTAIRFEQVSFSYPKQDNLVINGIDLTLPVGTTLALVGASGAGKSTLADLLPRFYDPIAGRITLDGEDLREYDPRSLRRSMGIVSQDTFLFNDSVRNNIAYGCLEATDDAVMTAAKRANAYEFILQLPQGFETPIGDRGVLLSGGQRQRIAIARALLRDPEILILDEATSALDTLSERLVQEAIDELSRDRTTLVIAHRLSTVQKADQIAVLDKGKVVEIGTHAQLLQQNGYYARLCAIQFGERFHQRDEVLTKIAHRLSTVQKADQIAVLDKGKVVEIGTHAELLQQNGYYARLCVVQFGDLANQRNEVLTQTSYEIRSRLNSLLGALQLILEGQTDTLEEQNAFTQDAYQSAVHLLRNLDLLEHQLHQPEPPRS